MRNKMNRCTIKILTSSQGRDLHIFLRPLFPEDYNIDVVFKPSATFAGVIENLHEIVQSLTPNDYLVIMGGSNDILSDETGHRVATPVPTVSTETSMDILGPCIQLAEEVVDKLNRGSQFISQNEIRGLSSCLLRLNELGDSLVRIIQNLQQSTLRDLLISLYSHLLRFVVPNEARLQREETGAPEIPQIQLPKRPTGGRPAFVIDPEAVKKHLNEGMTKNAISKHMGISRKTLYRFCKDNNINTTISDADLRHIITELKEEDVLCGEQYVSGELRARGHRVPRRRVRRMLRIVDPVGTARRHRMKTRRGKYSVKGPNYVWHVDGNEKLQHYRIYIHAAVDGFSRKALYLQAASDKKASTVAQSFISAVQEFGLPKRARSDKGRENVTIARIMLHNRGVGHGSFITGRSVHNVRVERFWKEVNRITKRFKNLFFNLTHLHAFDVDNEEDIFYLHCLFLPQIQRKLSNFQLRWNAHKIRTANYKSPNYLHSNFRKAPSVNSDLNLSEELFTGSVSHPDSQIWEERASRLFPNPLAFNEYRAVEILLLLLDRSYN